MSVVCILIIVAVADKHITYMHSPQAVTVAVRLNGTQQADQTQRKIGFILLFMKHVNKSFFLDFPMLHFKVFVKTRDKTWKT